MRNFKNYIVGYALADGHLTKYNTRIFASEKDLKNLEFINQRYPKSFIRHYPSHNAYCLTIQDKQLNQYLRMYIPIGNKTGLSVFPNGSIDEIKDFILGFLDGDGSFFTLNNGCGNRYVQNNIFTEGD